MAGETFDQAQYDKDRAKSIKATAAVLTALHQRQFDEALQRVKGISDAEWEAAEIASQDQEADDAA